ADVVEQASQKARARAGSLRSVWRDLQDLFRLLRAWADRSYARVPWRTLVMALGAVLYFLNPLDIAPDFIPFVGYLDDATVIAFVMRSIQQELARFREWEVSMK
ncbi:MAG: YkvA family protein, partial [Candidatus Acidiferrales bacterium]